MAEPGLAWNRDPHDLQTTNPHRFPHDEHVYPRAEATIACAVLQLGQRTVGMSDDSSAPVWVRVCAFRPCPKPRPATLDHTAS